MFFTDSTLNPQGYGFLLFDLTQRILQLGSHTLTKPACMDPSINLRVLYNLAQVPLTSLWLNIPIFPICKMGTTIKSQGYLADYRN